MGDFNLDENKRHSVDYRYKNLFDLQNETFDALNLIQLVEFPTWQRVINNVKKESTLDHLYVQDPTIVNQISCVTPLIGDHNIIIYNIIVFLHIKINY